MSLMTTAHLLDRYGPLLIGWNARTKSASMRGFVVSACTFSCTHTQHTGRSRCTHSPVTGLYATLIGGSAVIGAAA